MPTVLETVGLEKHFGGIAAVAGVSLKIEKGARHALIGPNGAGKTTVINLLTGVLRPSAGRILLEGQDITSLEAYKRVQRGLARTFQINQLFLDLTPLESVGLAISERLGSGGQWWRLVGTNPLVVEEIVEILTRFHLIDVMYERTGNLPYGKQRLVEIALAIACRPRVLLLDEPAAGVPEDERHEILATVAALPADVSVLLIAGYGEAVVLNAISLTLAEGQSLALLGRNGMGKTTLINSIVGVTRFISGRIGLDGRDITPLRPDQRAHAGIGWVPQERNIFKSLTVEENLTAVAQRGPWTAQRIYDLFPRLSERRRNLGNQLSGGEQQMLAVGRALILNPRLMLLDEPLEVLGVTDRVAIIERGAVVHEGSSAELAGDRAVLEAYLGVTAAGSRRKGRS